MIRVTTIVSAALLTLWSSLSAQQAPPRDRAVTGNAIVRGRVTDADGLPLPRTHLTLTAGRNRYRATTNPDGAYELSGIPRGTYQLTAERTGYLDAEYGVRPDAAADTRSPGISLSADETREHADFTLVFGGVIDGRVIDENGEPLPAQVEAVDTATALRYPGRRPTAPTQTNDLGRFRISGLTAGTYLISVAALEFPLGGGADNDSFAYAVTYYPGVLEPERATPITVTTSQHVEGVEFSVVTVPRRSPRALQAAPIRKGAATGGVTVSGRVTRPDGSPARRAYVSLNIARGGVYDAGGRVATTDLSGAFRIEHVPAGRYTVIIGSPGGNPIVIPGKQRPDDPGAGDIVEVSGDHDVSNLRTVVPQAAALVGRITDTSGRPVPDLVISGLEARFVEGRPVRTGSINMTTRPVTDALGEFRINGLMPGRYYVMASSKELWPESRANETLAFDMTFYPGVPYDGAQAVDVLAGDEAVLNFTMAEHPVSRISGRVLKATGEPRVGTDVTLQFAIRGIRARGSVFSQISQGTPSDYGDGVGVIRTDADGRFRFADVPAGDYLLSSRDTLVSEFITVSNGSLDGITLVEKGGGGAIDGTIVMDDGGRPPFPTTGIKPLAVTTANELSPILPAATRLDPNWHFFVGDLHAPLMLRLQGLPPEYAIAAVTRTNEDVTDRAITVTGDIDDVRIVLTRKTGTISGRVETERGDPVSNTIVVAFAENPATWGVGSRYVRTAYTDDQGRFTVKGLLAGAYRVAAPRTLVPGEWQNPDYLTRASRTGTRVTAAAGSSVADLKIKQVP